MDYIKGNKPFHLEKIHIAYMQQTLNKQIRLGWTQLYYGGFATAWMTTMNSMQNTIHGVTFYLQALMFIGKAVFALGSFKSTLTSSQFRMKRFSIETQCSIIFIHNAHSEPLLQDLSSFDPEVLL